MLYDDDDDEREIEGKTRIAYRGWCIVQIGDNGLLTSRHTECEPWREWRNVLMHRSLAAAHSRCKPGSVIVEVDGYGDDNVEVLQARLGVDAPLGQPRGIWAVCGDDAAQAFEASEAYGIDYLGVAKAPEHALPGETRELWRMDREFRKQFACTRRTMPRLHPVVIGMLCIAAMVVLFAALALWASTMPTPKNAAKSAGPGMGMPAPSGPASVR